MTEPLGYDPHTRAVYFRELHRNESEVRTTVYRLVPGPRRRLFDPVRWSIGEEEDARYRARVASLTRKLRPLRELSFGTIPGTVTILSADSVERDGQRVARFQLRAGWFQGSTLGELEVTTYVSPSMRVVRWYAIPGSKEVIGVASFIGVPFETGYELQVPFVMPGDGQRLRIPEDWWRWGYPPP